MTVLFANNATATLAGSYSNTATAITLTAGQGALFPTPAGGDYFIATIVDNANNIEIVHVIARVIDTVTIVRGQEGTAARALNLGDRFDMRITQGLLEFLRDQSVDGSRIGDGSVTQSKVADNAITQAKMADAAVGTPEMIDHAVTGDKLSPTAVVDSLGFAPIQQGEGPGQLSNVLSLGWSGDSAVKLSIDGVDQGHVLVEKATAEANSAGYRGSPPDVIGGDYTLTVADAARTKVHQNAANHVLNIPPHSAVQLPVGSGVSLLVDLGSVDITPGAGVTLVWVGSGATGTRHLAVAGFAVMFQPIQDKWYIMGSGLS